MKLLEELRAFLVGQGIVRVPRVAGTAPPLWLEPRDQVPAPGEGGNATEIGPTAVLAAWATDDAIPATSYESFQQRDIVEFWLRTTTATGAHSINAQLRLALTDKRAWQMAGMQIIESNVIRPLQLLTSDAQGYTYTVAYLFQRYAGLP